MISASISLDYGSIGSFALAEKDAFELAILASPAITSVEHMSCNAKISAEVIQPVFIPMINDWIVTLAESEQMAVHLDGGSRYLSGSVDRAAISTASIPPTIPVYYDWQIGQIYNNLGEWPFFGAYVNIHIGAFGDIVISPLCERHPISSVS